MPMSDVNQVATNLTGLQLKDITALTSSSPHHTNNLGRQSKGSAMTINVLGRQGNQNAAALSAEEAIVNLLERTKYSIVRENGQRRYGPPPDWNSEAPPRGCEVFIGKIPRDCFEDELIPVFEQIGPIYMFRLMMEFNGTNRGYGFCVYTNREDTKRAVRELDNYEIRKGKSIGVCLSVDNCRLFVGGIPKNKTREEILSEMKRVTDGVKDVISYPSVNDKTKNRGFAFVEYFSHKDAAMARRKLIPGRIHLWNQQIAVDWAEPEREVNEDIMSKVKILYVRNLMVSTSEEKLKEYFTQAAGDPDCVERVKKISDYAFIHFKEREQAMHCLRALNDTYIEGSKIEVTWAKPVDKTEQNNRQQSSRSNDLNTMAAVAVAAAAAGGSPLLFDSRTNNACAAAVAAAGGIVPSLESASSFLLPPTGQAAGVTPDLLSINPATLATVGAESSLCSPGGQRLNGTRTGRRNAAGSRSAGAQRDRKHPVEILEETSRRAGWGSPIYTVIPAEFVDPTTGRKVQLYIGQVYLPNLRLNYQATRYYATPEEAKIGASETAIQNLQYVPLGIAEIHPQSSMTTIPTSDDNGPTSTSSLTRRDTTNTTNPTNSSASQSYVSMASCYPINSAQSNPNGSSSLRNPNTFELVVPGTKVPNMSRSCGMVCGPTGSMLALPQFGLPSISHFVYPTACPTLTNQSSLPTSGSQYPISATFSNLKSLSNQSVTPINSTGSPSCPAFAGSYALAMNPNLMQSGTTFLPMHLPTNGTSVNPSLGLLASQPGAIQLSTNPSLSNQTNGPSALGLNNNSTPPDCTAALMTNGFDYSSQLLNATLSNPNLINAFGNPSAYYFDPNTMPVTGQTTMMIGTTGLPGVAPMIGVPQATTSCTTDLGSTPNLGQSLNLSSNSLPPTGLYTLGLQIPNIQTPPAQPTPTPSSQASVMNLFSQTQHLQTSLTNNSVSNIPSSNGQTPNGPANPIALSSAV